jgi:pilus assembly protein CpaB
MKPKTTILMILAIGCGLAAAFMTNKLIAERSKDAPTVETVSVLVAKKRIPAMTYIKKTEEFFEVQEKSKNDVPKNVLTDLTDKDLKDGFRVSKPFSEGGFLTRDDIISKDQEGLSVKVPPGMRAVAVRVTADVLAGGFVLPNSRVDVMWTYRTTTNEVGALTILQDVLVLAVDTTSARNPESPQTILGATVTVAVRPEDAQRLSLAADNGQLRLALRHVSDDKKVQLTGSTPRDLAKLNGYGDAADDKADPKDDGSGTPPVTAVPPLPAVPPSEGSKDPMVKEGTPPVATKDPPRPPEPETERSKKIHTLTIEDGPSIRRIPFVYDEERKSFEGSDITRSELESSKGKSPAVGGNNKQVRPGSPK